MGPASERRNAGPPFGEAGTGREAGAGKETRAGEVKGHWLADSVRIREGKGYPPFRSWSV